ncbi:DUF5522 domain-containing protein [Pseudoalteromonas fenneropenaei]|uniref:DUF5522 domain-containing protein n=1 Tax=Pseudoalteromonas fenneropenaei TaxID=1737459 RepID=A0ABV7CP97_9GAMM
MPSLTCRRCDAILQCQPTDCWCFSLPAILPLDNATGCLCRTCLLQAIRAYIASSELTLQEQITLAAPYKQQALIEGLDYDIEQGFMVFSRWYHLRRGACCGNGCRHCPWRKERQT